jgi:acetoin utilization deacetylase AcuC-like enzyme
MYWLGFQTVLIVGLDHRYPEGTKKHFYDDADAPGFDIGPGRYTEEQWERIGNDALKIAEKVYHEHGRTILNLTEKSACTAFEFDRIGNWL